ncbi:MAG: hypothetical protein IKP72_09270 [Clostridia bacterium]|nr:hypothetical protein [Clostridia bacterium]MBR6706814.1 hypothetical protein [Clostridia bacterium]
MKGVPHALPGKLASFFKEVEEYCIGLFQAQIDQLIRTDRREQELRSIQKDIKAQVKALRTASAATRPYLEQKEYHEGSFPQNASSDGSVLVWQLPAFVWLFDRDRTFCDRVVTKRCVLTKSAALCYGINAAGKNGRE